MGQYRAYRTQGELVPDRSPIDQSYKSYSVLFVLLVL